MKWVDCIYNSKYEISNTGLVRNKETDKFLTSRMAINHYLGVTLRINCKPKYFSVHRLIGIHFIPNPNNLPQINHIDGNKLNNNIKNLEWCTPKQNAIHAFKIGLRIGKKGEEHNHVKLSEKDIFEIRNMLTLKYTQREIAKKFNVNQKQISRIKLKQNWKHI